MANMIDDLCDPSGRLTPLTAVFQFRRFLVGRCILWSLVFVGLWRRAGAGVGVEVGASGCGGGGRNREWR